MGSGVPVFGCRRFDVENPQMVEGGWYLVRSRLRPFQAKLGRHNRFPSLESTEDSTMGIPISSKQRRAIGRPERLLFVGTLPHLSDGSHPYYEIPHRPNKRFPWAMQHTMQKTIAQTPSVARICSRLHDVHAGLPDPWNFLYPRKWGDGTLSWDPPRVSLSWPSGGCEPSPEVPCRSRTATQCWIWRVPSSRAGGSKDVPPARIWQ